MEIHRYVIHIKLKKMQEIIENSVLKINEIFQLINWVLLIQIVALGEITTKKLWLLGKISTFHKVFIVTLPLTIIYAIYMRLDFQSTVLTYVVSFWLHGLFVKYILDKVFPKRNK